MAGDDDTVPLGKAQRRSAGRAAPDPDLPTIFLENGALHRHVDESEDAILAREPHLFQRGGLIVRPCIELVPTAGGGRTPSLRLPPAPLPHIRECMNRAANYMKYDGRAEGYVPCNAPKELAETYQARGQWRLPPLVGAILAPLFRPDGSILDKPGYDPATGLLFEPSGAEFPKVKANATRDDALTAVKLFKALVYSYPLVSPSDLSVMLSAVLTAVNRRALPTAPLHGFSSPGPGSGKSHAVDLISTIATGQAAGVITQARSEEETEKRLAAALIAADAIISIDNCEFPLGGGLLCAAVSQVMIRVRMLGLSLNVEIPSNSALFATGNNLAIGSDMSRRMLLCTLDPQQERPELREFGDDPIKTVRQHRGKYVAAALTILRAFHNAGRPAVAPPIGSFVEWSQLVRNALLWLGEADPCETMEKARSADMAVKALKTVIDQWEAIPTLIERRKTVRELIGVASEELVGGSGGIQYRYADFRDGLIAVAGEGAGGINARRLGKWLLANQRRVCGGRRIVQDGAHAGVAYWKLELVEVP